MGETKKTNTYTKLRQLRNEKHYTNKDMGKKLNITSAFYCQIENRKRRLSYDMAIKIARIFKTSPDKLFYEETKDIE